ncbi:MAG: GDP-L-fucose synthase [Polyangiaceae bacterium]
MDHSERIFVAGHRGLVGSALTRKLKSEGFRNLVLRTHDELDLSRQSAVERFFAEERPAYVLFAAGRVGGILANDTFRADFIRDNLLIQTNVIDAAFRNGVKKFLFLGSSCIYPKHAAQPIKEEYLLSSALEPTNQPYALAKIAGLEMIDAYRRQHGFCGVSLMPTNLYGPHDNFDPRRSHVLPAMIRRFHEAKQSGAPEVVIWGTGTPRREFMHVDDLADACLFVMREYDDPRILNAGVGEDVTIRDLAELVKDVVGFSGALRFDTTKPDGTPRKLLDVSRLHALGWRAKIPLRRGIAETYAWFAGL